MKKMNMNELIQFVKSFTLIFMNTNNFKNELTSHIFQSLTFLSSSSFSSIYILQKNASRAQLQIETSLRSQLLYLNHLYLISRNLSSDFIQYMLIVEVFEDVESYKSKSYKKVIVNGFFRDQ